MDGRREVVRDGLKGAAKGIHGEILQMRRDARVNLQRKLKAVVAERCCDLVVGEGEEKEEWIRRGCQHYI